MNEYKIEIIETVAILIVYLLLSYFTRTFINGFLKSTSLQLSRRKMTLKASQLLITFLALLSVSAVWGLNKNQVAVFVTSMLTVLGIAFFAQWSLLSNVTSSVLLFFNHPVKIGDTIKILDKDNPIEGEVTDITYFFVYIRMNPGEIVSVPNNLLLQKPISVTHGSTGKI